MIVMKHPDYETENEWLTFAKQYMDIVIQASESTEDQFRQHLKQALDGIDFKDSSFSYMNMLTNSNLLKRTSDEVKKLKRFRNKPYFARIDFQRDETGEKEELYFGKVSLFDKETQKPIIVDWRSPIANLYYDGRLGDVTYEAEGDEYKGHLSLKRQFIIEEGKLEDIRDVDLTTTDELLQQSLSGSASNRLTDIVSTIQEEQNSIIRADLNKPIIVQGAAGSGKTTIALHRISYFIYTYAEHFLPQQLMVLAPNRLFIDYISEVLPELGVDNILQTTFVDYVKKCINKSVKLKHPDEKLLSFLNKEYDNPAHMQWLASFKGSLPFRDMMDRYLADILQTLLPKDDFVVAKFRLYKASKIKHLLCEEYAYLPYYKRVDKVKRVLQNYVRTEKKEMIKRITAFYDQKLEKALFQYDESPKRKAYVSKALDKKEEALKHLQSDVKTAVTTYIKKLPHYDVFHYYKQMVTNETLVKKYGDGILSDEQVSLFCRYQQQLDQEGMYEVEDLAPLLYLQGKLYGIKEELQVKNVVIDEAQDYSYFQLCALKSTLETDMFTIVGDLAQGIHSYRGIQDWSMVQREILPRATYKTLQKSYRTTVEIMNAANGILKLLDLALPTVEPVVRHGIKPTFKVMSEEAKESVASLEHTIDQFVKEGHKTIAIIAKTNRECKKIAQWFKRYSSKTVQLLRENEEINKEAIVIVSSHLSKGLEFDAVIICLVDEVYEGNEIDIKLLYVSMTRPLHRLVLYGKKEADVLLDRIDRALYD
ncbi:RNA polymerase recycling motor HelD [Metabacillus iocasae]|uniref:DNA helicase-2/ATP-dependent DNA helicase PcrA n=1 Tax=Priestia iocasae TaxID=2291674 RepID=A0ABS2QXS9_9BACI|nr:RNA polymerase recycling motor HelD [Metabacillus iocasae]MBM7704289.1 DNA helicase-2/ATP-dependent DNA helicase PcrA [Metabacillus iocasae]